MRLAAFFGPRSKSALARHAWQRSDHRRTPPCVPRSAFHDILRRWALEPPELDKVLLVLTHQRVGEHSLGSPHQRSKASVPWQAVLGSLGSLGFDPEHPGLLYLPLAPGSVQAAGAPPGYRDCALDGPEAEAAIRSDVAFALLGCRLCGVEPAAVLLLTPLGAQAVCGHELRWAGWAARACRHRACAASPCCPVLIQSWRVALV